LSGQITPDPACSRVDVAGLCTVPGVRDAPYPATFGLPRTGQGLTTPRSDSHCSLATPQCVRLRHFYYAAGGEPSLTTRHDGATVQTRQQYTNWRASQRRRAGATLCLMEQVTQKNQQALDWLLSTTSRLVDMAISNDIVLMALLSTHPERERVIELIHEMANDLVSRNDPAKMAGALAHIETLTGSTEEGSSPDGAA